MCINMDINKEIKNLEINRYIDDLRFPLKINTSVPTHSPKKWIDCFWVRDNAGTMELYIYIGGWKKITTS
jgi:hypothetical protein